MGRVAEGRPPVLIIFLLALVLDFILGSKVYLSVEHPMVPFLGPPTFRSNCLIWPYKETGVAHYQTGATAI